MPTLRNELSGDSGPSSVLPLDQNTTKARLEAFLKRAVQQDRASRILDHLFPFFSPGLQGQKLTLPDRGDLESTNRLANRRTFGRYFYFRAAEDDISEQEFRYILQLIRNGAEYKPHLKGIIEKGKAAPFIKKVSSLKPSTWGNPDHLV